MTHQLWTTLIRHKVSPNLLYYLDCCRQKIAPTDIVESQALKQEALDKGLLDKDFKLSVEGLIVLEEFETLLVKTKKRVSNDVLGPDFLENIKEYREMFPARRLPSGELARQSVQELKDKFVWFFNMFPEYDWNTILDATDSYIFTKSKENYLYMVTSSYFIHKVDPRTRTWKSLLADHCQMIQDNPELLEGH